MFVFFVLAYTFGYVFAKNCNQIGVLLYEDLQCTPVKKGDNNCPEKFDCNFMLQKNDGCLFKGRLFRETEQIESNLTYSACNVGCYCSGGTIQCAVLDCPEWLGRRPKPGCHLKYKLGECCSAGQVCPPESTEDRCEIRGNKYKIGQKFFLEDECQTCVCHENFNGKIDEKTCLKYNCAAQIGNIDNIRNKCAVAYFKNKGESLCCPDDWICPELSDEIKVIDDDKINASTSDLRCDYGNKTLKYGEGFIRKINKWGKNREMQCECVLPPFATCWQTSSEDEN